MLISVKSPLFFKFFKNSASNRIGFYIRQPSIGNSCNNHRYVTQSNSKLDSCIATRFQVRFFHLSNAPYARKVVPFQLSDIGEGISEVVVKEWFVNVGDRVNQFDSICEVQSDKASVTITSRFDGIVEKIHYELDQVAKVGKPLVDIRIEEEENQVNSGVKEDDHLIDLAGEKDSDKQINSGKSTSGWADWKGAKVLTTPAVRRLAAENKVRLDDVNGSGKCGRILKEDVLRYIDEKNREKTAAVNGIDISSSLTPSSRSNETKKVPSPSTLDHSSTKELVVPFTAIQRSMFKSMTQSLSVPHFGLCDEIDLTNLTDVLPEIRKRVEKDGIKVTFMPFLIKALSVALQKFPIINSVIDEKNESVIQKPYHNVGFALDTTDGLYVPNIKDVQLKSILDIAHELKRLQEAASRGQLRREDLSGGTITLSNIGSIGGQFGIPVIFFPQVAIGAIGQTKAVPRFNETDQVVKVHIANVLWSADHRVIDGATMCRFSNEWRSLLEEPTNLLLSLK